MSPSALGREPRRLPPTDLAGSFGPPDRASALTGLLTPAHPAGSRPSDVGEEPSAATVPDHVPSAPAPPRPGDQSEPRILTSSAFSR